ncbi:MAG: epoxyqueuosine reductase QueH [Lachnospiraceae bacterium]|nr:epoxyqueuosine reductase QueH [Lachnospiraceae bacterium]
MNEPNFQKELDRILADEENRGKKLFLHSCCAPCSSYVLIYLRSFFRITVFYYNPNITEDAEYVHRLSEQKRLIEVLNEEAKEAREEGGSAPYPVMIREGSHDTALWYRSVEGLEAEKEGGARCEVCFRMRLFETAKRAKEAGADYFGTTLTISPLKNAKLINILGAEAAAGSGVLWLPADFKKKEGYKQSIELSRKYELYRQDYCGCGFSKKERQKAVKETEREQ